MSNDSNIDWLEKSIANEYLNYFEYSGFKNLQPIRNGSSGSIVRVSLKNADSFFVLKTFNDKTTLSEIVNEVWFIMISKSLKIINLIKI